jgi:two-component system alkaline phosphatase synthesis response regulator PhoP
MERPFNILVVDDEVDICDILRFNLEIEGYQVEVAHSAEEVLERNLEHIDLMLLDVMMGEISGFKLASMLKKQPETAHIPIIFITARDTQNDTCTGLNLGADDYISKPFSVREVSLRVKAVLRRTAVHKVVPETSQFPTYKGLALDSDKKKVYIDNDEVILTKKEFEILHLLLTNRNKVFSREDILRQVWHEEVIVLDRTVDVNITRLRKKLGNYGSCIVTRQGFGYTFEE